jgi:hypothetical protein
MISIAAAVLPTGHREKFKENREVDLRYSVADSAASAAIRSSNAARSAWCSASSR